MKDKLKTILTDLYKIDPSLKEHEEALMKIVKQVLESRPDTKFNKAFARTLRKKLLSKEKPLDAYKAQP